MIGRTLSHYRILEKIGEGGMGVVYRAHDESLDRDVALKILPARNLSDTSSQRQLRKEALALSKLNHPNIEILFELNTLDDLEFLVVEYIPGGTLSDILTRGALLEKEVVQYGMQLADGLAAAHEQRIIHCDLKPGNLRITKDGRLKILDFGIAKLFKPALDLATSDVTPDSSSGNLSAAGTLPYMSPEQLRCEVIDRRSDIYSAGAVIYEMATGERPFREDVSSRLIDAILNRPVVTPRAKNERVSPELERIILKCLEKDPENRYQEACELGVDLRQLTLPRPIMAMPVVQKKTQLRSIFLFGTLAAALAIAAVVLNLGGLRDWFIGQGKPAPIGSIAVLALENLSGDPAQEFFAVGMTDELITYLAKVQALRVVSRTSVMQYKGTRKPVPQIARELGVDAVVEGSVMRDANRVRITVQLIHAATDRHLWAQSYEHDMRDVLSLQADVAASIAEEIQIAVTPQDRARLTTSEQVVPTAYEAYLKGRYHLNRGAEHDWQKARQYFEQAALIDPTYASAYAGLADYYWRTDEMPPKEAMPKAKEYALKALKFRPDLAEAHTSLGVVRFYGDWDWSEAEREFRRALELDPGTLEAHRMYSFFLTAMGRTEEALAQIRRAQQLDPLSVEIQVTIGWTFYYAHRYRQAKEECERILELEPDSLGARDCLGLSLLGMSDYPRALSECQKAATLSGNDLTRIVALARAQALTGDKTSAFKALDQLRVRIPTSYVPPSLVAQLHVALGDRQQALAWLEMAYGDRDGYLARLNVEPAFDSIRSDPGFQKIMKWMDFPQ